MIPEHKEDELLMDPKAREAFLATIEEAAKKAPRAVGTAAKRDEIRSMAASIASLRGRIDRARKSITEEWRLKTKAVNDAGADIEKRLLAVQTSVRRPLTTWEAAEEARARKVRDFFVFLDNSAVITATATAADVGDKIDAIMSFEIDEATFGKDMPAALEKAKATIALLNEAVTRIKAQEEERAELERLRAEAAELREQARLREEQDRRQQERDQQAEEPSPHLDEMPAIEQPLPAAGLPSWHGSHLPTPPPANADVSAVAAAKFAEDLSEIVTDNQAKAIFRLILLGKVRGVMLTRPL